MHSDRVQSYYSHDCFFKKKTEANTKPVKETNPNMQELNTTRCYKIPGQLQIKKKQAALPGALPELHVVFSAASLRVLFYILREYPLANARVTPDRQQFGSVLKYNTGCTAGMGMLDCETR